MTDESANSGAEAAFKALFHRLARIAIETGVTAPVAYRLMKEALVEAAEADFSLDGRRLTDSRISVLTGVHRKDIRAFRDANLAEKQSESIRKPTILSTVIGRWLGDPDLHDASGKPMTLRRQAEKGPSFDGLVGEITSDVRPRTLLDELERKGAVTVDKDADTITLTDRALIGSASIDDGLYFLERNVGDHLAAVAENMLRDPDTPALIERAVFYNRLTSDAVDSLQKVTRERGIALLEEINREALEHQTESRDDPDADERFRFGVYFYREAPKPADEDS